MPTSTSPALCVVSVHARTRRDLARLLTAQGHRVIQADGLTDLGGLAHDGIEAAIFDPRTPDLGPDPLGRMRAEPALHRCPIIVLEDAELEGLRAVRPAQSVIRLMLRIHARVGG